MSTSTTLTTFASLQNDISATTDLNTNFAAINSALANTLALNGQSPNQMQASLDMNSNRVINLPAPVSINEPLRLAEATTLNGGGTVTVSQLPVGGTVGQTLTKLSSTNFDVSWQTPLVNVTAGKSLSVTNTLTLSGTDGTTLTFQGTDTYVGRATTDSFSNKTFNANVNGNIFQMFGNTISSLTGTGALVLGTTPTINNLNWTGTITGTPSLAGLNYINFSNINQINAYSLLGNVAGTTSNLTGFTIGSLANKASPAAGDYVLLQDNAASGALKYALVSSVATAGSVSSIAGNTGAFTLGTGITNSTNIILADATYHRGYLSGCTLSGGGTQVLTVNAGVACSDDFSTLMKLSSNYTKAIQTVWAVGSGNGALDTGSIAASTWYHVYIIERTDTGVVDVLVSLSASAPTMPTNYTVKRRVGSIRTDGSANIISFSQNGDEFLWASGVNDVAAVAIGSTSAVLQTTTVPTGVKLNWYGDLYLFGVSNTAFMITAPDQTDVAPTYNTGLGYTASAGTFLYAGRTSVRTNTSAQIRLRSTTTTALVYLYTQGWIDTRGK